MFKAAEEANLMSQGARSGWGRGGARRNILISQPQMHINAGIFAKGRIVTEHPPLSAKRALPRSTLHSQIAQFLREMIVAGELAPGVRVPEKDLCQQFGCSRTPFREALKVLATEGLVVLLPQRGARVNTISDAELNEIFPIIASLEALAGEMACAALTDAALAAITAMHQAMIAAHEADNHLEYSRHNRAIHFAIFEAAGNDTLTGLYRNLELRIRNIRHTIRQTPQDWRRAISDHEAMLLALQARDAAELGAILRAHVMKTADAVRNALASP